VANNARSPVRAAAPIVRGPVAEDAVVELSAVVRAALLTRTAPGSRTG
jgi:hypothetical protein